MKSVILLLSVLILFSCHDKDKEILDLNDLTPQSKDYQEGKKQAENDSIKNEKVETGLNLQLLTEAKLQLSNLSIEDTLLFPDRFSPISANKFEFTTEQESSLMANYRFKDSIKTMNVFLNWMNCYGNSCKSIELGESANLQKEPFLMLVNDTSLIYILRCSAVDSKKWINYYTQDENVKWNYILTQTKGGKVKWQNYREEKFITVEPRKLNID